jgi:YEATS domain-containing protein 4
MLKEEKARLGEREAKLDELKRSEGVTSVLKKR